MFWFDFIYILVSLFFSLDEHRGKQVIKKEVISLKKPLISYKAGKNCKCLNCFFEEEEESKD